MTVGPSLRALLLDKDGPIVPLEPTWSTWAVEVLGRLADLAPREELAPALGVDPRTGSLDPDGLLAVGTVAAVAAALTSVVGSVADRPADEVRRLVRAAIAAAYERMRGTALAPDPGLVELLSRCRAAGVVVAVVTNDDRSGTSSQLDGLGIAGLIDVVVCGDDGHAPKPSGAMLTAACDALGVEVSAALMVGDTLVDLLAAEDAGTAFALLRGARPGWLPEDARLVSSHLDLAHSLIPSAEPTARREG
jgi:phosphoglycolate phosphatase